MTAEPDILAIQIKRIGDAVLTAPALGLLRARFPRSRITLVLDGAAGALAEGFVAVDEVRVRRRRLGDAALWAGLAFEGFDLCLDFTGTDRSAAMAVMSRASVRVGYARFCRDRFRSRAYSRLCSASVRDLHTVDFHAELVAEAAAAWGAGDRTVGGNVGESNEPSRSAKRECGESAFHPPNNARVTMRRRVLDFERSTLSSDAGPAPLLPRFAMVHPGTARPEKFWHPDRWAEVIRHLIERRGMRVVLTGSVGDPFEDLHLAALRGEIRGLPGVLDLAGRISLMELAALAADASLAVGVDSAAMHLAALAATPQVVLFGPTNPFHWRPRHSRAAVVRPPFQGPLEEPDFAPRSPGAAMRLLSTETVIRAIDHVLERDSQRGGEPSSSARASTRMQG